MIRNSRDMNRFRVCRKFPFEEVPKKKKLVTTRVIRERGDLKISKKTDLVI